MKQDQTDRIAWISILICACGIVCAFLIYDAAQPHYYRNTLYVLEQSQTAEDQENTATGAAEKEQPEIAYTVDGIPYSEKGEQLVYVSSDDAYYHTNAHCYARRSDTMELTTLGDALASGKKPCPLCCPDPE